MVWCGRANDGLASSFVALGRRHHWRQGHVPAHNDTDTDATGTSYTDGGQPHPTLAPDGKLVMWVSNMNGSARYDTFIARIPVK